ncbi:MAG: hypothetical protein JRG97_03830 [Deltaproteobacteria bacterium]|nr:hypothetical protein [Deltaproteobacteria bacterium]MBW2050865.1 hypothetical protein [Deltaproteobacteria bacterium]MBW2140185.1 hypothetical protein [Deltaproteobacteria bacterium]MBW2322688.1 hypothetical protein [Deltaproteobacteria bacterium]
MGYLKRIKEEFSFSRQIRRERVERRIGELTSREKRLYLFRNTLESISKVESIRS